VVSGWRWLWGAGVAHFEALIVKTRWHNEVWARTGRQGVLLGGPARANEAALRKNLLSWRPPKRQSAAIES